MIPPMGRHRGGPKALGPGPWRTEFYSFTERGSGRSHSNRTELAVIVFLPLTARIEMLLGGGHGHTSLSEIAVGCG